VARLKLYTKRKQGILQELKETLKYTRNRIRFIEEYEKGSLVLKDKDEEVVVKELDEKKYDRKIDQRMKTERSETEDENDEKETDEIDDDGTENEVKVGTFDYLLKMSYRSSTKKKFAELLKQVDLLLKQIKLLEQTTEQDMWKNELTTFETKYKQWLEMVDKEKNITKTKKAPLGKGKK
jgi:hypothetical protein